MQMYTHFKSLILVFVLFFNVSTKASMINDMVVFGDSLSDSGNLFLAIGFPPLPYFEGRFSNGLLYSDLVYKGLGLGTLTPSLIGGNNYAWGGARAIGDVPVQGGAIPGINTQVNNYLNTLNGSSIDPNTLHVFYIGNNDVADAINQQLDAQSAVPYFGAVINEMTNALLLLRDNGATQIVIPQVPDWGMTPQYLNNANAHELTELFNSLSVQAFQAIPGLDISFFDVNSFLDDLKSGFSHIDSACILNNNCSNPDDFIFFDNIHPTARVHALFADNLLHAVPVPNTYFLVLFGLLIIGVSQRKGSALNY